MHEIGGAQSLGGRVVVEVTRAIVHATSALFDEHHVPVGVVATRPDVVIEHQVEPLRGAVGDEGGDVGARAQALDARQVRLKRANAGRVDASLIHARSEEVADQRGLGVGVRLRDPRGGAFG